MFGAFGAVAGGLASIAPVAMIAVGALGIVLDVGDLINATNTIVNETGRTWCMVTRISLDLLTIALGAVGIGHGIRAWRASGSLLSWGRPPTEAIPASLRARIRSFIGMQGETAAGIRSRVPSDWAADSGYYTTEAPQQSVPQYRFTGPDGVVQLRLHGPQAPCDTTWVARIGIRVPEGTPGALRNNFAPGEFWLYFDNAGNPTTSMRDMHIRVNVTPSEMISVFGIGH